MGKVKSWAWDCAEKEVDDIIQDYVDDKIKYDEAKNKILAVQNLELTDIDEYNVDEVLMMEKEEFDKKIAC